MNRGSSHAAGRFHGLVNRASYDGRIDAMDYALDHDDGSGARHYRDADVILVGVSRSGKTPTCVYLALQFGIRAANYPMTEDDLDAGNLPALLAPHKERLFGLTIVPDRLRQIRSERRPNSRYASLGRCRKEVVDRSHLQGRGYSVHRYERQFHRGDRIANTAAHRSHAALLLSVPVSAVMTTNRPGADFSGGAFSPRCLAEALARMPSMQCYRVAFSGGADSAALLHALCQLRDALAPAEIRAVHVHHGLHADADTWESDCRRICADLGVALDVLRVDGRAGPGESPEAAARRARYDALASLVGTGEAVCTAHHQRDQAETLLLQLVRGAGPAGLAGMPALATLGRGWLARPLLDTPPEDLRDYLERYGLSWTEDPGNTEQRFDRNFIRHEILPRLEDRWPGVQRTWRGRQPIKPTAQR